MAADAQMDYFLLIDNCPTPSPTVTFTPTFTATVTDTATFTNTPTATNTSIVSETPTNTPQRPTRTRTSPPNEPTRTSTPVIFRPTSTITAGGPTFTPSATPNPLTPTASSTEPVVLIGTPGVTPSGTVIATLGAPVTGGTGGADGAATAGEQQLIPVGGADLASLQRGVNVLQTVTIQLGLLFLGLALALHGLTRFMRL